MDLWKSPLARVGELTVSRRPNPAFWRGRRVLLTGHTGFKGGWAALWLNAMGADVTGLSLAPQEPDSLFESAQVGRTIQSCIVDLRNPTAVRQVVEQAQPQIVLHLAAQALVRQSVADPVGTMSTNVLGTAHLLDALRQGAAPEVVLVVTSDKVYANSVDGRRAAFTEDDQLGGKDPYSASKAATELVTRCYARTWFDAMGTRVATARGGNVIGGGDFSADRLVPDLIRSLRGGDALVLRHPDSTRPWQHVLDCVAGYFVYAEALAAGQPTPDSLNFGPPIEQAVTVGALADALTNALGAAKGWRHEPDSASIEMPHLSINAERAFQTLGFRQRLGIDETIRLTAAWYNAWLNGSPDLNTLTRSQIAFYADSIME